MAKWWEELPEAPTLPTAPRTRGLARVVQQDDPQFLAEQQALDDADFIRRREAQGETARALNQSDAQLRAALPTVRGLARTLVGDEEQGQADLIAAREILDREAQFAPKVRNLEDIESVGDVGAYARNAVLSNLPTMVPSVAAAVTTGGLSGLAGAGLRGLAKRGLANAVGRALTYQSGQAAGALAGSSVLQAPQMLDAALDTSSGDTARERAAKAVVGAVTTGALDALPQISLLNRLGVGGAAKRAIAPELSRSLASRFGREAGKQALQEGTTEAIQSLGEKLTHRWVNENVEVLGPKAYMEYLNSFVAGGLVGGAIGGTAGFRSDTPTTSNNTENTAQPDARSKVKDAFAWFKGKDQAPRPAAEFDQQQPASEEVPEPNKAPTPEAPTQDLGAAVRDAAEALATKTKEVGGLVGALFGKNHAIFEEQQFNSDFDMMLEEFRTADKYGRATSEDNGIIGRTQNDGIVRGGIPFNGFSLFNPDQAQGIWDTGRQTGKPVSAFQAFALSALDPTAVERLGKEPVKAAALYLSTGERTAVDEDALVQYMRALPSQASQMQFLFAADRISEMVKRGREANGPQETTPRDIRDMVGAREEPLRTDVDIDDKLDFDLGQELNDDSDGAGTFADYQQQRAMDTERPAPVSLNEVVGALPFVDTRQGQRRGAIRVTNSKGNPRDVSLASLVAQGWQAAKDGVFTTPNGVVDVVAQALDTLQQRGMTIDPAQIKAGLWLGGDTKLTPRQAQQIREGMKTTEATRPPVQETPGVPNVPPGDRPFDANALRGEREEVQGEDGIENLTGEPDLTQRPRTRSPLGLRVDAQGRIQEAETIDTEAADNVADDQRLAENDAITALHRANEVIAPGTVLKGNSLSKLMENFGKRANALKKPTKEQQAAIDGARRAIQRIERNAMTPANRLSIQKAAGITNDQTVAREQRTVQSNYSSMNERRDDYAAIYRQLALEPNPATDLANELDSRVSEMAQTPEGRETLLAQAERSYSTEAVVQMMLSAVRAVPNETDFLLQLHARLQMVQNRTNNATTYAPGRARVSPNEHKDAWASFTKLFDDANTVNVPTLVQKILDSHIPTTVRQRSILKLLAKSKVLDKVEVHTDSALPIGPHFNPDKNNISMDIEGMSTEGEEFVLGMHPVDVLVHEATHALTTMGERVNRTVSRDLDALLKHVRKHAAASGYPVDFMYGLLNTQEFMAEAFSNPEMQEILRRIPALNTESFKNVWEQFKGIIAKLFEQFTGKAPDPTALDEALTLGMEAGRWTNHYNTIIDMFRDVDQEAGVAPEPSVHSILRPANVIATSPNPAPSNLFYMLNKADRARLEKALRDPKVYDQIYKAAPEETKQRLDQFGPDLATLVNMGAALHSQGKLDLSAAAPLTKVVNFFKKSLGLPSNADVFKQVMSDLAANQIARHYDGEQAAFNRNEYTKTVLAIQRALRNNVQPVYDKLTQDMGNRMRESMVPSLRRAAALFESRVGENVGEQSYVSTHQQFFSQHATDYMEAVGKLKNEQKQAVARALQANVRPEDPTLATAFDNMRNFFNKLYTWAGQNGAGMKFRRDYFPVVMDRKLVEDNWDEMKALLVKPEYEQDIRAFFKDNTTPLDVLGDRMVQIAQTADASHVGEVEFGLGIYTPSQSAARKQIMGFLNDADRATLAKFQSDSLDAITLGYISQMSKKAAFVRVFGAVARDQHGNAQPNRLGRLRARAKREGATDKDMEMFDNFAKMMLGSYHAELNPTVRWVLSKVDKVLDKDLSEMSIEEWAHYQQVVMTYNNFRLLGLAPLSSLIDSLGTLARGGSITDAAKSIWDGIRAFKSNNELREMAQDLGIVEKYALSDALAATYGGTFDPQGKLGRLNNALFRYNGLEAITRHSRFAALAMGHRFMLRHAQNPTKHSERYLKELQLTAADIQADPNNPRFVKMTPKVEEALRRFVFESVVRPQPSQRPGWHNDPNFLFAAQYKGYLYAFYTTIVGRMMHEAQQGNYSAALIPMVPYLGVTAAAEMLRYAIQHPGEDDPRDPADYMQLAAVRSGLVGPRFGVFNDARTDTRYGSWITNSWIGPTGQQATDFADVAMGNRSFGKTAIEALPGSAIFEDWNWSSGNDSAAEAAQ